MENTTKFANALRTFGNYTTTENGATALKSTNSAVLDAFGSLGAMRNSDWDSIVSTFDKAFMESPELAMRMLFYMRDIRGGQGERKIFRTILRYLAMAYPHLVIANFENILEFGRADDMLELLDGPDFIKTRTIKFIKQKLEEDWCLMVKGEKISLLAKWLPSVNASSETTKRHAHILYKGFNWTERHYRKTLSKLRNYLKVVETKMSARKWDSINYEAVPAKAAMNYRKAFDRHDSERYKKYIFDLAMGKAKANSKSLFPVDIIHKVLYCYGDNENDRILYNAMWENLPNYFADTEENAICMIDTSGSMHGTPYEVAVSLGLYCADKNKGPFHNMFITFAENPEIKVVSGANICEKVRSLQCINAGNTDIEAAFNLILETAVRTGCKPEDMPRKLYIISDMQFDEARGAGARWTWAYSHGREAKPLTFMEAMRKKFTKLGYTMPSIVYWNVRESNCGMFQETVDGENCAMVSGYSPSLFEAVIKGTTYEVEVTANGKEIVKEKIDPITVMLTALLNERYDRVVWKT